MCIGVLEGHFHETNIVTCKKEAGKKRHAGNHLDDTLTVPKAVPDMRASEIRTMSFFSDVGVGTSFSRNE